MNRTTFGKSDDIWAPVICGCYSAVLTNPIEVAKTRFQLLGETQTNLYRSHSTLLNMGRIYKCEGSKVWTKGVVPSTLYYASTHFFTLLALKHARLLGLEKPKYGENFTLKSSFLLTSIIGLPGTVMNSPLYLAKIRMQSKIAGGHSVKAGYQHFICYGGTIALLKNIYQAEVGPRAIYRAAVSNYIKFNVMTSVAIYCYVKLDKAMNENQICPGTWRPILLAGTCGLTSAFVATPFDLISTRLYNQGVSRYGGNMFYNSYKDCLKLLLYREGFNGLYKYNLPATFLLTVHSSIFLYLSNRYSLLYEN